METKLGEEEDKTKNLQRTNTFKNKRDQNSTAETRNKKLIKTAGKQASLSILDIKPFKSEKFTRHEKSHSSHNIHSTTNLSPTKVVSKNKTGKRKRNASDEDEGDILQQRKVLDDTRRNSMISGIIPNFQRENSQEVVQEEEDEVQTSSDSESSEEVQSQKLASNPQTSQLSSPNQRKYSTPLLQRETGNTQLTSAEQLQKRVKSFVNNKVLPNHIVKSTNEGDELSQSQISAPQVVITKDSTVNKLNKAGSKLEEKLMSHRSILFKSQMKGLMRKYLNRTPTVNKHLEKQESSGADAKMKQQSRKMFSSYDAKSGKYSQLENGEAQLDGFLDESQIKEKSIKEQKCLFRVNDFKRIKWDLFVMILAIWNCYSLPFDVAFQPDEFEHPLFKALNYIIDVVFFLDILVNFRTTYFNPRTGDEISDPKLIAKAYMKGRFWIDILATFPFDSLLLLILEKKIASKFQLLSMLKLLRVLRLGRIITYMNSTDDIKLTFKLMKLFFFLIMYVHCQGCAWYYIVSVDDRWLPIQLTSYGIDNFFEQNIPTKYWISFYSSVQLLTGGDVLPYGNLQTAFASFFLISGALINANIFGNIAVIVSTMNRKASRFQEQIDIANTAMRNMKIPEALQWRVQDFMMYTQSNLDNQKELDMFLTMISPSLRLEVIQHIFLNAIDKNDIFRGKTDLIEFVVHNIITLLYLPEDSIIRQGQKGQHFFFLAKGECEVWVRDQFKRETYVKTLSSGKLFGEVALIAETRRTASVKSKNYCTLAALNKENFFEMCQQFPDTFFRLKYGTTMYSDKWKMFQKRLLVSIDYLKCLSEDLIDELHYMLQLEHFDAKADIFQTGDTCKALYFVVEGEIDLLIQQGEGDDALLDTLYQGCSIGSYSMLKQERFPYTARTRTNCTILVLPYKVLQEAKEYMDELEFALWEAEEFIISNGVPLCDYKIFWSRQAKAGKVLLPIEKFRNACRRVMILNKRNRSKPIKIFEVLKIIHEKFKIQQRVLSHRQKTMGGHQKLPPFMKKHFINHLKNHTAENILTRTDQYVKMLTFKIESLSDTVANQNQYIARMHNSYNQNETNLAGGSHKGSSRENGSSGLGTDDDMDSELYIKDQRNNKQYKKRRSGELRTYQPHGILKLNKKMNSTGMNTPEEPNDNFLNPNINYGLNMQRENNKNGNIGNNLSSFHKKHQRNHTSFMGQPEDTQKQQQQQQRVDQQLGQEMWDTGATVSQNKNQGIDNQLTQSVESQESLMTNPKKKVIINFADIESQDTFPEENKKVISRQKTHKRQASESTAYLSQRTTHFRVNSQQTQQSSTTENQLLQQKSTINKETWDPELKRLSSQELLEDRILHDAIIEEESSKLDKNSFSYYEEYSDEGVSIDRKDSLSPNIRGRDKKK